MPLDLLVDLADPVAIVRVELPRPGHRVGEPLVLREAEQLLDLRAHVEHAPGLVAGRDVLEVDDRGQVLDDVAEAFLVDRGLLGCGGLDEQTLEP